MRKPHDHRCQALWCTFLISCKEQPHFSLRAIPVELKSKLVIGERIVAHDHERRAAELGAQRRRDGSM